MKATMRYVLWMLLLSALFQSCSDDSVMFRKIEKEIPSLEVNGCQNKHAVNVDLNSTLEDGSCQFEYCNEYGYVGYDEVLQLEISEYLEAYGRKFNGQARVTRSCGPKLIYCEHPDSLTYVPGPYPPKGYHSEYCKFVACDKERFEGRAKFEEYTAYLLDHPGELNVDNSDAICGPQIVFDESYETEPDKEAAAFEKVEITFILDDSGSMSEEIDSVKRALINLAPTFVNLNTKAKIDFVRMSQINNSVKEVSSMGNNLKKYEYQLPPSLGTVDISQNTNANDVRVKINEILDDFNLADGFGDERGLCMTLRHLNDTIRKSFEPKTQYISIIISDEDEHAANNSSGCTKSFIADSPAGLKTQITSYKDNNGDSLHISSFTDLIRALDEDEQKAYGWFGIFYDQNNSACTNGYQHGETYLNFAEALKTYDIAYQVGDVCSNNYTQLIYDKLINGFLNKVSLKYKFFEYPKAPVVNAVYLYDNDGNATLVSPDQYTVTVEGEEYFIQFIDELESGIFNSEKIKVDFTWFK